MRKIDPNLIRAYFDGELSPEEAHRVQQHLASHPEDAGLMAFEERLKQGVRKVMSDAPMAPAALEQSIREAFAESRSKARPVKQGMSFGAWLSAMIGRMTQPKPVSVGAVFGVVLVVGAAVLFGIFYPQIDATLREPGTELIASDPAEYASQEHDRCARNKDHRAKRINVCTPHEASLALSEHFQVASVTVFDLSEAGYEFIGETRRCGMPGAKQSAQLLYQRQIDGQTAAKASIFLTSIDESCVPTTGCGKELRAGEWQRSSKGSKCRKRVFQTTDHALVYYLVTCDEDDAAAIADVVGRTLLAKAR